MEDDNELELSLGLRCGGSSAKLKGQVANSDSRIDAGDNGNKIVDDFRNFFQAGTQKQELGKEGSQKNDQVEPQENIFNNLINATEVEEEKMSEVNNKRKMLLDEMTQQKKLIKVSHHAELYDQARTSHFSIATEGGSTAENEGVADSEVDVSTSRLVSSHTSEVPKENHRYTDSSVVESQQHKRFNIPSENEFKLGSSNYGVPYTVQQINMMSVPYSLPAKESNPVGATGTSGYPLTGMIHVMPSANGERPVNSGDLPLAFGYPSVQLPVLDKDHFWGLAPHSQQLHPPFVGRGAGGVAPNSGKPNDGSKISQVTVQVPPPNLSERGSEPAKGDDKNHEGSSSHKEGNRNSRTKDASGRPTTAVLPHEGSSIRPGAAADLKFGGCGSCPNLPWVSTTAPGPNGRTISGVTYRFSGNQIRIVCACHGSHMSPEEFVRHASEEHPNPDTGNGLAAFPSGNPAASAQT